MNKHTIDIPVELTDPQDLLTPWRFDFAAKHLYARLREKKVSSDWGRFVYAYHLRIWNEFFEDAPRKTSEADFLESFHRVIEATRNTPDAGLRSLIPLTRDGIPLNGAHRIVAALLLKKMVACATTEVDSTYADFDQRYFEKLAEAAGQSPDQDVFDAMALEFCRLLPNISIAVKFPAAKGSNKEVEKILSEHATIFYKKAATFENAGPVHLMRTLYGTGPHTNDHASGRVYFYLLAYEKQEDLLKAKERFKNQIHLTDTRDDALRVARLAFSNPGIRFANARLSPEMPVFNRLFAQYRTALAAAPDAEDFCIDGDAVMAAYGIRDCDDLGYISHADQRLGTEAGYRNDKAKTLDDIIFNHTNHFYLDGVKCATLENLRDCKRARGDLKDQTDIALIEPFISRHAQSTFKAKAHLTVLRSKKIIKRLLPEKVISWLKTRFKNE